MTSNVIDVLKETMRRELETSLGSVELWKSQHEKYRDSSSYRNYSRALVKAITVANTCIHVFQMYDEAYTVAVLVSDLDELDQEMIKG
ncbi:hypothetical protein D3C87_280320 [compost metagenome]